MSGGGWLCRIKVCQRGESAAPSLLLSLAWSTGTSLLAVCVCMRACLSEGSCVWWIQPGARWPAVNYGLLINLGKGTHRAREREGMTSVCPHLMWQDKICQSCWYVVFGLPPGTLKTHETERQNIARERNKLKKARMKAGANTEMEINNIMYIYLIAIAIFDLIFDLFYTNLEVLCRLARLFAPHRPLLNKIASMILLLWHKLLTCHVASYTIRDLCVKSPKKSQHSEFPIL